MNPATTIASSQSRRTVWEVQAGLESREALFVARLKASEEGIERLVETFRRLRHGMGARKHEFRTVSTEDRDLLALVVPARRFTGFAVG